MNNQPNRRWSFSPEDPYKPYQKRRRKPREELWVATEHRRHASYMERAYDVDDKGRKMVEVGKRLVLDPRPSIMKPERVPIFLGLDQSAT